MCSHNLSIDGRLVYDKRVCVALGECHRVTHIELNDDALSERNNIAVMVGLVASGIPVALCIIFPSAVVDSVSSGVSCTFGVVFPSAVVDPVSFSNVVSDAVLLMSGIAVAVSVCHPDGDILPHDYLDIALHRRPLQPDFPAEDRLCRGVRRGMERLQ